MNETNMQNVRVTRISIPFGDMFWLTFKAIFASLLVSIILVIPWFLLFLPGFLDFLEGSILRSIA